MSAFIHNFLFCRQGNGINTRASNQQSSGAQSGNNDLQNASMGGQNVSQQNQNVQQIAQRATVYPIPNYAQQDLQNARQHQMNAGLNAAAVINLISPN